MYPQNTTFTATVAGGAGAATGYSQPIHGRILAIRYVKPDAVPLADTADFTFTTETTGQAVLVASNNTASKTWRPRPVVQAATDGSDLTGVEPAYAGGERVKVVVAQGGSDGNTGTFIVTYG